MSVMSQIYTEITEALEQGYTFEAMVEHLQSSYSFSRETAEDWILDIEADVTMRQERDYNDSDNSDDGYALSSAGFGTDEDYGSHSDIDEY